MTVAANTALHHSCRRATQPRLPGTCCLCRSWQSETSSADRVCVPPPMWPPVLSAVVCTTTWALAPMLTCASSRLMVWSTCATTRCCRARPTAGSSLCATHPAQHVSSGKGTWGHQHRCVTTQERICLLVSFFVAHGSALRGLCCSCPTPLCCVCFCAAVIKEKLVSLSEVSVVEGVQAMDTS